MEKIRGLLLIFLFSMLTAFDYDFTNAPTGEEYITGEDGIKRIYINIWGHVKKPGSYLVYEDIDIITLLSIAGGPLDGANLSKVEIIDQKNNSIETLDIETLIKSEEYNKFKFNPYDTITIKPTYKYYLLNNASAINMVLQIITLVLTVQDN